MSNPTGQPADRSREEAVQAVQQALAAARQAHTLIAGWSDDVRAEAEQRLGIEPAADDPAVYEDPDYGAALDTVGAARTAVAVLERVLADLHPSQPPPADATAERHAAHAAEAVRAAGAYREAIGREGERATSRVRALLVPAVRQRLLTWQRAAELAGGLSPDTIRRWMAAAQQHDGR